MKEYEKKRMEEMEKLLEVIGYNKKIFNKFNPIHITGTKGKGSTCIFVENIIRQHGIKTGLFTSPHLIEPTERIRINGKVIEEKKFIKYYWDVYNQLKKEKIIKHVQFFKFMTLMAVHSFYKENIECGIFEVGIGGRLDPTNIIPEPIVTGITSIGQIGRAHV